MKNEIKAIILLIHINSTMQIEIRRKLIELARLKTHWTYSQLNDQLQLGLNFKNVLDRDLIGEWLGEISMHEFKSGRPLLNSLIVHQSNDREQGDGFYKLCEQLLDKPAGIESR